MNKPLKSSETNMDNKPENTETPIKPENIKDIIQSVDAASPHKQKYIPFWSENPNILFQQKYGFELFPIDSMTYEQKLNAVSRTVVILTIAGFLITRKISTILVGGVTMGAIFLLFFYRKKEKEKNESKKIVDDIKQMQEGFENPAEVYLKEHNLPMDENIFMQPTSKNPFSNVLMTDYDYNPNKKPALPAFNPRVNADIINSTKQLVRETNPDQPDITDKIYRDLGDQLVFEQSLRQFNSNPATTIPNDSGTFAQFCYGSMISNKEGNVFAAAKNLPRHNLY